MVSLTLEQFATLATILMTIGAWLADAKSKGRRLRALEKVVSDHSEQLAEDRGRRRGSAPRLPAYDGEEESEG